VLPAVVMVVLGFMHGRSMAGAARLTRKHVARDRLKAAIELP
jgi:hypothetical protein